MPPAFPPILNVGSPREKATLPSASPLVYVSSVPRALFALKIRAAARQPTAEETEEGQERVDQDGELTLPADEQLGDVDETEAVLAGESKSEEAEDEAGPFEEAPNLADIELEE